jgi:predicted metal-dependent hydrolase
MPLLTRSPRFVFSSTIASHWCPNQPEFSHAASAFMAALPYLEPYFIHNVREALPLIADAQLKDQAEGFIAQEARHAQQHRRFNQLLAQRYPDLPRYELAIRARLDASKKRDPLAFRLAYTSGYEAITCRARGA